MSFRIITSTFLASSILLAGCAQPGTENGLNQSETEAISTTAAAEMTSGASQAAAEDTAQSAPVNPVIAFGESSTELDELAQEQINQLLPTARRADKIVIYGYSDRNNPGNAKEIAISRALRVRTELVKNGVPLDNIRIRYSTMQARHEAKVLLHEDKLTVADKNQEQPAAQN